ncbi:MAG: HAMP domain-containing sensor histidine kinase [Thermodesulfovibrionales bacterium]|nr:HAMP domain-containing sensor histidine kinase [Thermodesulfovibrionales bacterium]
MKKARKVQIAFTIDKKLRILSWDRETENIFGNSLSRGKGSPYYEVIPGFSKDGIREVNLSVKNGQPLKLNGNKLFCFYSNNKTDIYVTPLKGDLAAMNVAKIQIHMLLKCNLMQKIEQQQKLIDIGRVATTLAHGIRNPLNTMKGAVTFIKDKCPKEKKLIEFTTILEEEISRLDQFISNFLSTSMGDTHSYRTNINTVLRKIQRLLSRSSQLYNIHAVFEYGKVASVMINPFHLEHSVLNVINNAIEAMPAGGQLIVKSQSVKHNNIKHAVIEVTDTGIGMPPRKYHELMTKPYINKSKGIGLFITNEIIRSCNGHLEIKSSRGKGTTVTFYLPLIRQ